MKYKIMIPLSAAGFLLACQPNESLTGRTPPPGAAGKQAAGSKTVEGAFVAPADANNVPLAPIANTSANILVGTDDWKPMTFTCVDDVSKVYSFSRAGAIRLAVGSQIVARQNPEEEIPGKPAEKPATYVNINCKPGVASSGAGTPPPTAAAGAKANQLPKPATSLKTTAGMSEELGDSAGLVNMSATVTTAVAGEVTSSPTAKSKPGETPAPAIASNIQTRTLAPGYYATFSTYLNKEQKTALPLDISCMARESMDKATSLLARPEGARPIDLVIGTGSQILLTTHFGASTSTSKFVLIKCGI